MPIVLLENPGSPPSGFSFRASRLRRRRRRAVRRLSAQPCDRRRRGLHRQGGRIVGWAMSLTGQDRPDFCPCMLKVPRSAVGSGSGRPNPRGRCRSWVEGGPSTRATGCWSARHQHTRSCSKRVQPGDYDNKSLPFSRFSTSGGPKLSIRAPCGQVSAIYTMFHKVPEDVVIEKRVNVSQDRITVRAIDSSYRSIFPKFYDNHFIPAFNVDDIRSHVINPR